MPVIVWNGTKNQVQRVSTITLVKATIAQLELGLRWLHDHSGDEYYRWIEKAEEHGWSHE